MGKKNGVAGYEKFLNYLRAPIISFNEVNGFEVPEWLKKAIFQERLEQILSGTFEEEATDSEVLFYLMEASFSLVLKRDYAEIYLYLGVKVMKKFGLTPPKELEEFAVKELTPYQKELLSELKRMIRKSVLKAVKSSGDGGKKEETEKEESYDLEEV